MTAFVSLPVQVFFVESICDDPDIIAENIKVSEPRRVAARSRDPVRFSLFLLERAEPSSLCQPAGVLAGPGLVFVPQQKRGETLPAASPSFSLQFGSFQTSCCACSSRLSQHVPCFSRDFSHSLCLKTASEAEQPGLRRL